MLTLTRSPEIGPASDHARPPVANAMIPGRVSFVVPTRNSSSTIRRCLSSIDSQSYPEIELIVVDNYSTDDTPSIAQEMSDQMLTTGPERSAQRNAGAQASTGEFLVFIDSDMVVPTELSSQIIRAFRVSPDVGSLVLPERSIGRGFWAECRQLEKELYLGDDAVEAPRAFRRGPFFSVGGFDEALHAGEDWDLAARIDSARRSHGRVDATITHDDGRLRLGKHLSKKRYYGYSIGRYVRSYPRATVRQLLRPAQMRNWALLVRSPVRSAGLLALKVLEVAALLEGMVEYSCLHGERRKGTRSPATDASDDMLPPRFCRK